MLSVRRDGRLGAHIKERPHPYTHAEEKSTADGVEAQTPQGPSSLKHYECMIKLPWRCRGGLVYDFEDVEDVSR